MAYSEAHREQSKQGLITLSTRKTDKLRSITIIIQQRLSFADVTSVLLAREKEYKHICLPAISTDDIKPEHIKERYINGYLDPIRLNEEALNNNKIDLGIDAYFCQFLQAPANEKNGIFKKEWFNFYKEITYKECYIFVDTAQKTKEYNDYSAFGVFTVINDNLYLLEMVQKKLEYPDALKEILSLNAKYNPRAIYIEDKSSGTSLIQDIKRTYRLPIREIPRTTDKVLRANQVSAKVEAGYCYIRENQVEFLMQVIKFPDVKNDDMVDVFIDAVNILIMKNNNKLNKVNVQMW